MSYSLFILIIMLNNILYGAIYASTGFLIPIIAENKNMIPSSLGYLFGVYGGFSLIGTYCTKYLIGFSTPVNRLIL